MLKIHVFFRLCLPVRPPPPPPIRQYKPRFAWGTPEGSQLARFARLARFTRARLGTLKGFGTERTRLGTYRGFGTERNLRGFGTERERLGTFRGFGTKREKLGTFNHFAN